MIHIRGTIAEVEAARQQERETHPVAWHARARANGLPPAIVGGVPLHRPRFVARRPLAPECEAEKREAWGR
jgi:hypothetical protein